MNAARNPPPIKPFLTTKFLMMSILKFETKAEVGPCFGAQTKV